MNVLYSAEGYSDYRDTTGEYDHVHSAEEQMILAEAVAEEVAIEKNAAYGLRTEDQLQAEQVTTETNLTYGIRREQELQENPVEQVTDSAHHFNSDPQLPEHDPEGYSDYRDTTGYAQVLQRQSSHKTTTV